jgi:hypothetical protein
LGPVSTWRDDPRERTSTAFSMSMMTEIFSSSSFSWQQAYASPALGEVERGELFAFHSGKQAKWMAERLATVPAMQVARVRFPVLARPTFSVEKWLFSDSLRQGARCKHCNCTV